uniref:Jacalin-related lectin n=1 Tax=Pteria penguin TaxID=113549 RepID=B6F0U0_PTEPN|nr:jacalin-related lectin [Pteria penguin]
MGFYVYIVLLSPCLLAMQADAVCTALSESYGGPGGLNRFDENALAKNGDIKEIELLCGRRVTAIRLRYGSVWGTLHGWKSPPGKSCARDWDVGVKVLYTLQPNEYVKGATITYDRFVNSLTLKTNMRQLPKCGKTTGSKTKSIDGRRLKYITGNSGCILDRIQFYWPSW